MSDHVPTRHPETPRLTRSLVALALLGLVAAVCSALGFWQLERAQLRRDLQHTIAQGRASPTLTLVPNTPSEALHDWRAAQAHGAWRHDLTILLDNRNQDGRPGYWVVTPLVLDGACVHGPRIKDFAVHGSSVDDSTPDGVSPDASSSHGVSVHGPAAVLVLRGWLPRRFDALLPNIPAPPGAQRIHGQLLSRVPRIYELPSLRGKPRDPLRYARVDRPVETHVTPFEAYTSIPPVVTNLTLDDAARATKLALLPIVLQQLPDPAAPPDGLVRQWAGPSLDADKNIGYAMQWFSFAAIALCAALALAWRTWRAHTHQATSRVRVSSSG